MKGNAKCRNWGGFEWLGVTLGDRQHNYSTEHMRLPILSVSFSSYRVIKLTYATCIWCPRWG